MDDNSQLVEINSDILEEKDIIESNVRQRINAVPCSAICKNGEPCKNKTSHPSGLCSLHRERTKLQKIASKNNGKKLKAMFDKLQDFKLSCNVCSLNAKLNPEDPNDDSRICPMFKEDGICTIMTNIKDVNEVVDTENKDAANDILTYMLADQIMRLNTVIITTENILGEIGNYKVIQQQEMLMKMLKMYNEFNKQTQPKKDSIKLELEGDDLFRDMLSGFKK